MKRSTLIPVALEAKSRSELSGRCLENNMKFGYYFEYFDFQKDGKRWVCWYYADIHKHVMKKQIKRILENADQ